MTEDKRTTCKYYNSGFCKFRNNCYYFHSEIVCTETSCIDKKCYKRHPKLCRYKDICRRRQTCLYRHEENEDHKEKLIKLEADNKALTDKLHEFTLKIEHTEKHNNEIEDLKNENSELKLKEATYKKDIEKLKTKIIFINTYKIEIEQLKRELENAKEADILKETEHKKVLDDLKHKIKVIYLEKAQKQDIEMEENGKTDTVKKENMFKCNGCDYKSCWETYVNEHKKKCNKAKKRKK